jgi:hypothetical protein
MFNIEAKEGTVLNRLLHRKQSNNLYLANKKDALKASQESARPHLPQAQGVKV